MYNSLSARTKVPAKVEVPTFEPYPGFFEDLNNPTVQTIEKRVATPKVRVIAPVRVTESPQARAIRAVRNVDPGLADILEKEKRRFGNYLEYEDEHKRVHFLKIGSPLWLKIVEEDRHLADLFSRERSLSPEHVEGAQILAGTVVSMGSSRILVSPERGPIRITPKTK
jgi:hypothetical protein